MRVDAKAADMQRPRKPSGRDAELRACASVWNPIRATALQSKRPDFALSTVLHSARRWRPACAKVAGGILLMWAALACPVMAAAQPVQPTQPQKFLTFDRNLSRAQIEAQPNEYVFVWGTSNRALTTAYMKYSPDTLLSSYFPYSRDPDAKHGARFWSAYHPTWVVRRCDGVTPATMYGDSNIVLDISNPDVVAWQVANFLNLPAGVGAVALDNFQFAGRREACGAIEAFGRYVKRHVHRPYDTPLAANRIAWLQKISAALHEHQIKVVINHIPDLSPAGDDPASPLVVRMVSAVDGILDEHAQDALHDANKAVLLVKLVQYVQSRGKWMYLLYQLDDRGSDELESAVANYLIMAGPKTAIYVSYRDHDYGHAPDFSGFDKPVGVPCGPAITKGGVLFRTFSHGLAIYAPFGRNELSVSVPDGYQTVNGRKGDAQINLVAGHGRILYTSSTSGCERHH